jgi:hypothetical protein
MAEEMATAQRLAGIELYTNAVMRENHAFYAALGYVETGRGREAGYDRVYYCKPLPGPSRSSR